MIHIQQRLYLLTLFMLTASFGQAVQSNEFHYNDMLIGDRASGLAGAYVAVSDDSSGLYYNPAGIVYAENNNLAASMNAFNVTVTRYKDVLNGNDWERKSSALLPNFFGITQKIGPGIFGFSYAVADAIQEDQSQTFIDVPTTGSTFSINFKNQDTTTYFGPSYAITLSDKLSIGLSLFAHIRSQELVINQFFEFEDDSIQFDSVELTRSIFHSDNKYVSLFEYGTRPILGIIYSPTQSISIGLTISKTVLFSSDFELESTLISNIECEENNKNSSSQCINASLTRIRINVEKARYIPWETNFGIAYFVNRNIMITSSLWLYEPVNGNNQPLLNAAIGLEYYILRSFAIRLGSYTNFANTPEIEKGKSIGADEHIDIFGATLSLSHFTRTSTLTLGVAGTLGSGKAQILDDENIQDIEYFGFSLYLSGSNSF